MSRNTNGTGFSLKDELFNQKKVQYLANLFKAADDTFPATQFEKEVMQTMLDLELKERIVHIATVLESFLDSDFKVASKQIISALPERLDPANTDDDFGDFIFAPLGEYVVRNGLSKKHLRTSLQTLQEITMRFSMEDAIRYFINEFPEETFSMFEKWVVNKNYHVRRLVSEGTRPLLPWSGRLCTDIKKPLPFLYLLHADPTRYVTRSVANHLNDIAKREPAVVIDVLKKWRKQKLQSEKELDWMTRHALRTLLKQGNKDALSLLGYTTQPDIVVTKPKLVQTDIALGEVLEFSVTVTAKADARLMVDYVIGFVKANGEIKPKVFKLKTVSLNKGESIELVKRHPIRPATTTAHYSGMHTLALQINGILQPIQSFRLET